MRKRGYVLREGKAEGGSAYRITGALLIRVTHHVHIMEWNGESFRPKQSKARRMRAVQTTDDEGAAVDPETGEITPKSRPRAAHIAARSTQQTTPQPEAPRVSPRVPRDARKNRPVPDA